MLTKPIRILQLISTPNLSIEVLLSCVHQQDMAIVKRSNLQNVSTIVINQCNISEEQTQHPTANLTWIDTPSRGLSVSRNLAIKNATADVCVIADDDEIFEDNLAQIVQQGYAKCPQADVVIFTVGNRPVKFGPKPRKLRKWELLKINSVRTTFRLNSIRQKHILFDTLLGSGTGNGPGEENKFVLDCYNKGLQIYFVPLKIATVLDRYSNWFHGYDEQFFYNRGKSTRYIFGFWFACLYGVYFLIAKYPVYQRALSPWKASKYLFQGIFKNELKHHD